jgi:putative oxidoreductase
MRRLYPQFLGGWRGIGLLFIRLVLGTAFILHGWQKIENPLHWMDKAPNAAPAFLQLMAVVAEVGGGALLIVGLLTPIATFLIACNMIGALALVHLPHGDPFIAPTATGPAYERALVYLAVSIGVMLLGPGRYSLDTMLFKRRDWVAEEKKEWLKIPAA